MEQKEGFIDTQSDTGQVERLLAASSSPRPWERL